MTHRALKVRRGTADRDPMFTPVWYDGIEMVVSATVLAAEHPEFELLQLPPTPDNELRWKRAIERADEVLGFIHKHEPVFDREQMIGAVRDVIDTDFTPDDVLAAYRKRMEAKRS
jgi:hypothetical protein